MKPTAIFKGTIADMRQQGQHIDYELAEHNTRAILREQSVEEEQASRLFAGFQPIDGDMLWPMIEEGCPYVGLGTKCDPICVYCDMKHVCMHCALKPRSVEASIDPPCPMRIPGCRCSSSDAGSSILEYFRHAGNPFMGACMQDARDEERLEEETGEDDIIEEETEDDGLLEASGNKSSFNVIGGEEALDDENENEEFFKDDTRNFLSPQSLWPLSPVFWKGPISRDLPSPSQSQVDYHDYSGLVSEPPTIGPQCAVAAGQHAWGGRSQSSLDVLQLPTPYNPSSPFFLASQQLCDQSPTAASQHSPAEKTPYSSTFVHYATPSPGSSPSLLGCSGLDNQDFEAAARKGIEGKTPTSGKPATEESRPSHKRAAVGEARSAQQSATKKDSRGWEGHEKALVQILLKEVILEGTHAWTEERWKVISRRLSSRYAIDRTWTAVKNYWNRHGRNDTGVDERKVKKPERMITGVQDPESRRQARNSKRKDAESHFGSDVVDLVVDDDDDDDDFDSAPSKRRRL